MGCSHITVGGDENFDAKLLDECLRSDLAKVPAWAAFYAKEMSRRALKNLLQKTACKVCISSGATTSHFRTGAYTNLTGQ